MTVRKQNRHNITNAENFKFFFADFAQPFAPLAIKNRLNRKETRKERRGKNAVYTPFAV